MKNPKVYLDIAIGTKAGGRLTFELFADITPKTAENFRGLCTGEYGQGMSSKKKLHFLNSRIFRVIPGFVLQGGDIEKNNGDGGESIYGGHFRDENFSRTHSQAGILSMANCGRNTNSSQFFVTFKKLPQLNSKHVVFGQLIDGMEIVRAIEKIPTDPHDRPLVPIRIVGCGQLGRDAVALSRSFIAQGPLAEQREQIGKLMGKLENASSSASATSSASSAVSTMESLNLGYRKGPKGGGRGGRSDGSDNDDENDDDDDDDEKRRVRQRLQRKKDFTKSAAYSALRHLHAAASGHESVASEEVRRAVGGLAMGVHAVGDDDVGDDDIGDDDVGDDDVGDDDVGDDDVGDDDVGDDDVGDDVTDDDVTDDVVSEDEVSDGDGDSHGGDDDDAHGGDDDDHGDDDDTHGGDDDDAHGDDGADGGQRKKPQKRMEGAKKSRFTSSPPSSSSPSVSSPSVSSPSVSSPSVSSPSASSSSSPSASPSSRAVPSPDPREIAKRDRERKLFDLRMQINSNRKLNNREVLEEKKRLADPTYEKRQAERQMKEQQKKWDRVGKDGYLSDSDKDDDGNAERNRRRNGDDHDDGGSTIDGIALVPSGRSYLLESASATEERERKKKKKDKNFGWNVFNQDALYKSHKKRMAEEVFRSEEYDAQKLQMKGAFYDPHDAVISKSTQPSEEAKDRLAAHVQKQIKKRAKFSRRRAVNEEMDVSYINDRNEVYNKKLERAFGAHTREIKQNLERGTAL